MMNNNNIKCMSDIYEMDIMEVDRQFGPLLESYYSRLERILDETGGDFDKASDKDKMIIEKMEAVLTVMRDRLEEAGLYSTEVYNDDIEEDDNMKTYSYNGNERTEALEKRFFDILENGGHWNEIFLIRDLFVYETIHNHYSVIGMLQIDDIIEETLEAFMESYEDILNGEARELEGKIFKALHSDKDVDKAFELVNEYGECANYHPYIYYCAVRELERMTGENYIELCL